VIGFSPYKDDFEEQGVLVKKSWDSSKGIASVSSAIEKIKPH